MGRVLMFMDFLGYGNHVALYSEEISRGGEGLGVSLHSSLGWRWVGLGYAELYACTAGIGPVRLGWSCCGEGDGRVLDRVEGGIDDSDVMVTGLINQNTPQAFSHVTLISAAFNLDRALSGAGTGGL
jgi:hypothetical protein